ncbi:MAG: hypothetical protein ACYDD4_08535 [Acidimicrobiales bacterium]
MTDPRRLGAHRLRAQRAALVPAGAAALSLVVPFLAWSRSGSVVRSGFSLLASAQQAGLVTASWARVLAVVAYCLPTTTAFSLASALLGSVLAARLFCAASGAVLLLGAVVALDSAHGGTQSGVVCGVVIGSLALLTAIGGMAWQRGRR